MAKKVKLKKTKACKIAFIEHTGPYGEVPYSDYFNKLYGWAKKNKVRPGCKPLGLFLDCPENTAPEQCRSQIAIPICGNPETDDCVKVKDLPELQVATLKHVGPPSEYANTYGTLNKWIAANGYEQTGPTIEVYTKKPKYKGGETILYSLVQIPIKKK